MNHVQHSDSTRSEFGAYLRSQRERRDLSLADIARITKIPRRSLAFLEDGAFESLPAEVFVRGFLRSYARCVGMDPEDTVARYREAGRCESPGDEQTDGGADAAGEDGTVEVTAADGDTVPQASATDSVSTETEDYESLEIESSGPERSWSEATGAFIVRSLLDRDVDGDASRRGTVTLAVIILVILATLTTSYWLRRPSSSGSGVTDAGQIFDAVETAEPGVAGDTSLA